jgi:hypothetical protein
MDIEAQFAGLQERVARLEAAQSDTTTTLRWVVAKLGGMAAKQDEHTLRLERITATQDAHTAQLAAHAGELASLRSDVAGLRRDMPGIVRDAMRDVLSASKSE